MPVFLYISGYFSKKFNFKRILSLLITYILWQSFIFPLSLAILTEKSFQEIYRPLYFPQISYWYLLAIVIWRIITPLFSKLKYALPISILLSLTFGFLNLNFNLQFFTVGRLFVFYPFFLAGFYSTQNTIDKFTRKNKYMYSILFFIIISLTTILIHYVGKYGVNPERMNRILMPHYSYAQCYTNTILAFTIKSILLLVGFIAIPLLFSLSPSKNSILSNIGKNSLIIYLSHMIFIETIRINYLSKLEFKTAFTFGIIACLVSILYCIVLSNNKISNFLSATLTVNIKTTDKTQKNA